jgi:putative Ca2+/H+ antiporter (TMEM165/GDT1 family)
MISAIFKNRILIAIGILLFLALMIWLVISQKNVDEEPSKGVFVKEMEASVDYA